MTLRCPVHQDPTRQYLAPYQPTTNSIPLAELRGKRSAPHLGTTSATAPPAAMREPWRCH